MNVLICGYRDWAKQVYLHLPKQSEVNYILVESKERLSCSIAETNPDLIFFIGWSWIVETEIVNKYTCLCMHPSPLPKYRGGSPIQHQIINGEVASAVSFFKMTEAIDMGDLVFQKEFSLEGDLVDIFDRIINLTTIGIEIIIDKFLQDKKIQGIPQDNINATYYKRRIPKMSEITIDDIENNKAKDLFNKIRSLQDPYPNAYIVCKDGTKLFIQKATYDD